MSYIIVGIICFVAGALTIVLWSAREALKEKENWSKYREPKREFEESDIYDLHPHDRPKLKVK